MNQHTKAQVRIDELEAEVEVLKTEIEAVKLSLGIEKGKNDLLLKQQDEYESVIEKWKGLNITLQTRLTGGYVQDQGLPQLNTPR
jgi:hypothetical protein